MGKIHHHKNSRESQNLIKNRHCEIYIANQSNPNEMHRTSSLRENERSEFSWQFVEFASEAKQPSKSRESKSQIKSMSQKRIDKLNLDSHKVRDSQVFQKSH